VQLLFTGYSTQLIGTWMCGSRAPVAHTLEAAFEHVVVQQQPETERHCIQQTDSDRSHTPPRRGSLFQPLLFLARCVRQRRAATFKYCAPKSISRLLLAGSATTFHLATVILCIQHTPQHVHRSAPPRCSLS
jgi:hypothetical protein